MNNPIRLLILAIVQEQDLDVATRAVSSFGAPVVYLASAGGFLGRRNATILIGLPKGREEDVLRELRKTCRQTRRISIHATGGFAAANADSYSRDRRRRNRICPAGGTLRGDIAMKMIILIVKDSEADALTRALTSGEYRVTRIASTGGFLRSGVATLLLGVNETRSRFGDPSLFAKPWHERAIRETRIAVCCSGGTV